LDIVAVGVLDVLPEKGRRNDQEDSNCTESNSGPSEEYSRRDGSKRWSILRSAYRMMKT